MGHPRLLPAARCPLPAANSDLDEHIAQAKAELSQLHDNTPASPAR
jgi:hypothetical protein